MLLNSTDSGFEVCELILAQFWSSNLVLKNVKKQDVN